MVIEHVRRTASLSLAILATLTACTGPPGSEAQSTATSASNASVAPTSVEPTASISLEPVQRFDLGKREAWPFALTPTGVLAPVTSIGGASAEQVWLLDLATGGQSVVARTEWPGGAIGGVAAAGQWAVWVDMKRVQTDSPPWGVLWKIWAKNLATDQQILLDTNGTATDVSFSASAPRLISGDGYVGWAKPGDDGFVRQLVWRAGWASPRTLSLQLQGFIGASAIVDGKLIFRLLSDVEWRLDRGLGDCWSSPIDGSEAPQSLTHSGLVRSCKMTGTDLVWTEHIDPKTNRKALVSKAGDYPYKLMTLSLTDPSAPRAIHQGIMQMGPPIVGTDFTWWVPFGAPVISSLTSPAQVAVKGANRDFIRVVAADGQLVAYQLRTKSQRTIISVARVVSSSP